MYRSVLRVVDAPVVCETLVACGSELDAVNVSGDTPLIWAVDIANTDVVRLFLALNADTTKTNSRDWIVSQSDNAETLQRLSEHSKKTVSFIALPNADVTVSILFSF